IIVMACDSRVGQTSCLRPIPSMPQQRTSSPTSDWATQRQTSPGALCDNVAVNARCERDTSRANGRSETRSGLAPPSTMGLWMGTRYWTSPEFDQADPDQAEPDQAEPDHAEPDQAEPDVITLL